MDFLNGGGHRIKLKRHEYIRAIIIGFCVFAMLVIIAFEIKHFNNTFNVQSLVIASLVFAIIGGVILSYILTKDQPEMELLTKLQIWVAVIVLSMVVMPPMANLTNRLLTFRSIQEVPVEYIKSDAFFSSRFGQLQGEQMDVSGYHIFIIKDGNLKRIKTKTDPYEGVENGTQILLPVRKGFFGYDYVVLK